MKTQSTIYLAALLGATTVSAQVEIPGQAPGSGNGAPQYGEMSGAAARGTLRQPYNGGVIMPAWRYAMLMSGEYAEHYAPSQTAPVPQVVPGYQRMNMATGEAEGEFFSTVIGETGGSYNPYSDPYGGMDPSMYTDPSVEGPSDPYSDPYGGMEPSM